MQQRTTHSADDADTPKLKLVGLEVEAQPDSLVPPTSRVTS